MSLDREWFVNKQLSITNQLIDIYVQNECQIPLAAASNSDEERCWMCLFVGGVSEDTIQRLRRRLCSTFAVLVECSFKASGFAVEWWDQLYTKRRNVFFLYLDSIRSRNLSLIGRGYSSISLQDCCNFLGTDQQSTLACTDVFVFFSSFFFSSPFFCDKN